MINKCSIPRQNINSGPTDPELMSFAATNIIPHLAGIIRNKDYYVRGALSPTKARYATIKLLRGLGNSYVNEDHEYISRAFELVLEKPELQFLKTIVPPGYILDLMEAEGTVDEISDKVFTDAILEEDSNEADAVDYFLHKAYGTAVAAKNRLERKMTNVVLNSFVVNRTSGTVIPSIQEALKAVDHNKKNLLLEIQAYFKLNYPGSEFAKADLSNMSINNILDNFRSDISQELLVGKFLGNELQNLYDTAYNDLNVSILEKTAAHLKLNAYGSWLALQHFDNFIKMSLGDTIVINPSTTDRYSYSTKGTNVNTTWRKDDNIDLQAEINKLTQALINTSPLIAFGTKSKITDGYLQFSDFSYITAKIKDLIYDSDVAKTFIKENTVLNFDELFTPDEKRLIKNKSLRQIISNTRYNPQKYLSVVYKILTAKTTNSQYFIDRFSNFNSQDKTLLWSIYKNLYDSDENGMDGSLYSLYSIQKNNTKGRNYYAAVSSVADCIFSVDFVQYYFEDGIVQLRTLRDAAVDNVRWELENIINTKNSTELSGKFNFNPYSILEFDVEGNFINASDTNKKMDGITFQLDLNEGLGSPDVIYVHTAKMGDAITFSRDRNPNGKTLNDEELKTLYNKPAFYHFIDEILGLNLEKDAEFRIAYLELSKSGNDDITPFVDSLLKLSSHIFLNRYFELKYLLNAITRYDKTKIISKYYTDTNSRPRFNNAFFNMHMVPKKKHETMVRLAQALSATRGLNSSRQVKDSDHAMLSSQTLSRLLGNLTQQLDIQINAYNKLRELEAKRDSLLVEYNTNTTLEARRIIIADELKILNLDILNLKDTSYLLDTAQNPAASHFELVTNPDLFKGFLKSEEIKGLYGNKKQVKFTTAEAVMSSFLHNFVLGHCDSSVLNSKYSPFGGGIVGLLPSVNSDKTTVSIAKFNLNAEIQGTNTRYIELDSDGIKQEIRNQIGDFYIKMYENIENDFKILQDFAQTYEGDPLPVILNINSGFSELNSFVDDYNANLIEGQKKIKASEIIFKYVNLYNQANPTKPLRLIDQVHYISKGNYITANNTIKSLNKRFKTEQATNDFFNLKSTEVLKSALDSGFVVNLYGDNNLNKLPEINYLRQEKFKIWCNKSGQMVLAKIKIGEAFIDVASKLDLKRVEDLLTINAMQQSGKENAEELFYSNPNFYKIQYGYNNLINNIHKLKDNIILHPMLDKYNLFDYLFTLQLMCSTVGSHVAHPPKVKRKTPIIWGHPGIGKTFTLENSEYGDKIIDWDTQFNARRDAWISQRTGIPINSKEFKAARNEYIIRWEKHEDYQNFVEREWERIKHLANSENKILVASPHMLLAKYASDFDSILTMSVEDFVKRGKARGDKDPEQWKEGIDITINNITSNPLIAKKIKTIDSGLYLLDMIKAGYFNKELAKLRDNEMEEEASRFYAQHKRNVSFTASMDQFLLNQIDGIPLWYNIAIIDDIYEGLSTIDGSIDSAKPFDGATFVNPFIMYLENNSLNEARAGIDKKLFVHFYDELTGSGGIIKTAGFALTNDRMRNSVFYRRMMKNMTDKTWKDYQGKDYDADITKDFLGNTIDYGTFYYKLGNKYYSATIKKGPLPNLYIRTVSEVNKDGSLVKHRGEEPPIIADTNYKLWLMFGGMHSQELVNGVLKPSETSLLNVTKAIINTGELKPNYVSGDITAENVDLPLKNSDIHYMPTIGAVKQGAANINPLSYYYGEQNLNFFRIRMTNAGILLDKEHHADGSQLSLMTLVISSACSMGFNPEQADRLYKALYKLTIQGIKKFKLGFLEVLQPKAGPDAELKFEEAIAECMVKNMITSTSRDGDMLRAIASELIEKARKGDDLQLSKTPIPYSDPAVFNKLVSNLSVIMTKAGIKAKMDGILSVLCPTNTIVKMYNFTKKGIKYNLTLSQMEEMFGDDYDKFIDQLLLEQPHMHNKPDFDFTQILVGLKYLIKFKNKIDANGKLIKGMTHVVDVKYPHNTGIFKGANQEIVGYEALKLLIKNGHALYGEVEYIQDYIKDGKELGSINYKFKDSKGRSYQIWDINYIQDLFKTMQEALNLETDQEKLDLFKNLISAYDGGLDGFKEAQQLRFKSYQNGGNFSVSHELKLAKRYAKKLLLDILFNLSANNPNKLTPMKVNGEMIELDKTSIETLPYEIVMPKIFLKEFGLDEYSNLDEIIKNSDYFLDVMRKNFRTKVLDETHYDLELKRANGLHIYLKDRSGLLGNFTQDLEKVPIHTKVDELGNIWRIDLLTNDKMYQLASISDEVYKIPGTDIEIILTSSTVKEDELGIKTIESGITFYLDKFKYLSLHISEAIAEGQRSVISTNERPRFDDVLSMIESSSNKGALYWLSNFKPEEGKEVNKLQINKELNSFRHLSPRLKRLLREQSKIMHTSLLKSLDIIAARIPALNQLSFMPMRVVAWENPNVNTAYVSVMQFFLQGSDLDIDAVSLLTFSFSPNGEFYDWSPDFDKSNKEMLNLSMELPFPSGDSLRIINYETLDKAGNHVNELNRKSSITDNEHFQFLLKYQNDKLELLEQNEHTLQEYENKKEALKHYIELLKFIEKSDGYIYFKTEAEENAPEVKDLIDRINKHNLYFEKANDKTINGAIKNYVVGSLFSISTDAANLLEAHTGVDVATGPIKKIANKSELSEVLKTFTPGNIFNKFLAIEEASVGKDDIAICATGLKGFFAATLFCNSHLNNTIQDETLTPEITDAISKIITFLEIEIGGRRFNSLANIRVDDLSKVKFDTDIYNILKDKGFDDDASVIMSALLSLSTDNAKELCLAKINAGTSMIGMYLYGAAIGMDFEVMNKIIASPLGFTVAKLLNSNEFTLQRGKTSINAVLDYLEKGPSKSDLNRFKQSFTKPGQKTKLTTFSLLSSKIKEYLENEENSDLLNLLIKITDNQNIAKNISEYNIGYVLAKLVRNGDVNIATDFLNNVRTLVNKTIETTRGKKTEKPSVEFLNFRSSANQLFDFLLEFIELASTLLNTDYVTEYGNSNIIADLNKLALGADEFKRLGLFLRLNLEIKTKPDELINFVLKIETVITERAKLIADTNVRLGIKNPKGLKSLKNFDFKAFAESFIKDPYGKDAMHNLLIEIYEKYCKTCINPLRILTTVPHYKGYLESMILAYEGDYMLSIKFRAIKRLGNQFITDNKIKNAKEKTSVYKGVQSFVDDYVNNAYLQSQGLLQLPKNSEKYPIQIIDTKGKYHDNEATNTYIQLGKAEDNRTFENFFEKAFIPALKAQKNNNMFVSDLKEVLITDPITGIRYLAISLPINMMPSSDNERILFNKYKNDFNKIAGGFVNINGVNYSIAQMFQYYNLLKFKGKAGRSSLLSIFEDIMAKDPYMVSYRKFIYNFDKNYDFAIGGKTYKNVETGKTIIGVDTETLYKYLAPLANPYATSANIIKYQDPNIGKTVLLEKNLEEKEEKEKTNSITLDDDFDYEDEVGYESDGDYSSVYEGEEENYEFVLDTDYDENEEGSSNNKFKTNYGSYHPLYGDGVLTRFNPPSIALPSTYDLIINHYSYDGNVAKNITIKGGRIKQLMLNNEIYDINDDIEIVKIREVDGKAEYYVDTDDLNSLIETINCGK